MVMALKKCVKEPTRKKNQFKCGYGAEIWDWMGMQDNRMDDSVCTEEGGRMKKVVLNQYEIIALGMGLKYIWNSEREE